MSKRGKYKCYNVEWRNRYSYLADSVEGTVGQWVVTELDDSDKVS